MRKRAKLPFRMAVTVGWPIGRGQLWQNFAHLQNSGQESFRVPELRKVYVINIVAADLSYTALRIYVVLPELR